MTSTLIFFLLIFIQHHPPPPPPSSLVTYSVIVVDMPGEDDGREWSNGRFANAVRGRRPITSEDDNTTYLGFCQVYEAIEGGLIVDLNRRNWSFLTNWIKNNPSDGNACGVTLQDACRFALEDGGERFNTRCRDLYLPLSKKLIVFLIFSFILIVFCRTSKSLN